MAVVEQAVQELIKHNVLHLKSGIRTAEATWVDILPHMVAEIRELNEALVPCKKGEWKTPHVEEELADIYGILVHAVLKAGFSMDDIENRCLQKFEERFEDVYVTREAVYLGGGRTMHELSLHVPARRSGAADNTAEESKGTGEEGAEGSRQV